ncbi:MAG: alpha/beta hydrolase [Halanaerobium sp.]|nr:alpha/beta hydrolase [Halanaerobium sp.]
MKTKEDINLNSEVTIVEIRKVKLTNGETLAFRLREGGDHNLVMIHGNMSSSLHWDLLMENMPAKYNIFAPDLRGFGESSYNEPITELKDFARDLKYLFTELNLANFDLIGWSTGGGIGMEYAASYPEDVGKLILLESVSTRGFPIPKTDERGQPVGGFVTTREEIASNPVHVLPLLHAYQNEDKQLLKKIWDATIFNNKQPTAERYDRYLEENLKQRNLVDVNYALATFNISREDNGVKMGNGRVDNLGLPVLVIHGTEDRIISEQMAKHTVEDIGENARLVTLDRCGHFPAIDDLDNLLEVIDGFLST